MKRRSPTRLLSMGFCFVAAAACSSADPIEDSADSPTIDRSVARWSEPGAMPDPRPDAALVLDAGPLDGGSDASSDATTDGASDAAGCQLPIYAITQVSGDTCAFDVQMPPSNVDTSLFVVRLSGQLLREGATFDYTITGTRLRLRAQTCTTFSNLDAGVSAIVVSYGSCVNLE